MDGGKIVMKASRDGIMKYEPYEIWTCNNKVHTLVEFDTVGRCGLSLPSIVDISMGIEAKLVRETLFLMNFRYWVRIYS